MESSVGHTQNSEAGLMINLASTFSVGQDDSSARGLARWDFSAAAGNQRTCRGKTSGFDRAPGTLSDVWGSCTEATFKHDKRNLGRIIECLYKQLGFRPIRFEGSRNKM